MESDDLVNALKNLTEEISSLRSENHGLKITLGGKDSAIKKLEKVVEKHKNAEQS